MKKKEEVPPCPPMRSSIALLYEFLVWLVIAVATGLAVWFIIQSVAG